MCADSHANYIYKNVHDLCLGRAMPPIRLRSHLEFGRRYLVSCVDLTTDKNLPAEKLRDQILEQMTVLEGLPNHYLKELLVTVSLDAQTCRSAQAVEKVVHPVFKKMQDWRSKRMLKTALGVQLCFNLGMDADSSHEELLERIIPVVNDTAGNGADLLWLCMEDEWPGYQTFLQNKKIAQALHSYYEYYEKISMLYLGLACHYLHGASPLALQAPTWGRRNLPQDIESVYSVLLMMIEAKLQCLPSLYGRPNCLQFQSGSGALAKAMTGAPLIAPNSFESKDDGINIARAFADSLSTRLDLRKDEKNLSDFRILKQAVDYFNTLHESGSISNQETRNILIKSVHEPSPLMYILYYPQICEIAQKLMYSTGGFLGLIPIFQEGLSHILKAEQAGRLYLSQEEQAMINLCRHQLSAQL